MGRCYGMETAGGAASVGSGCNARCMGTRVLEFRPRNALRPDWARGMARAGPLDRKTEMTAPFMGNRHARSRLTRRLTVQRPSAVERLDHDGARDQSCHGFRDVLEQHELDLPTGARAVNRQKIEPATRGDLRRLRGQRAAMQQCVQALSARLRLHAEVLTDRGSKPHAQAYGLAMQVLAVTQDGFNDPGQRHSEIQG